jgi:hypothetical protein
MGGGLMQLVAYGAQDIYLTGNPQITFFKVVYRRHTNFSMETIQQTIQGTSTLSNTSEGSGTVTISRNGDLVKDVYVVVNGGKVNHGPQIIKEVDLEIGGQLIDKQTRDWMKAWWELSTPAGKQAALKNMMSDDHQSESARHASDSKMTSVQIPLQFWFCRNPGLALPLIALQYHEVKLKFTWGKAWGYDDSSTPSCLVYCDYIYLDTDERRRFAQVSHEYLIEQVQKIEKTSAASTHSSSGATLSAKLNFNHPVKELVWTYPGVFFDDIKLTLNGHDRFAEQKEEYFTLRQPYQYHTSVPGHNLYSSSDVETLTPTVQTTTIGDVNLDTEICIVPYSGSEGEGKISFYGANGVRGNPDFVKIKEGDRIEIINNTTSNLGLMVEVTSIFAGGIDSMLAAAAGTTTPEGRNESNSVFFNVLHRSLATPTHTLTPLQLPLNTSNVTIKLHHRRGHNGTSNTSSYGRKIGVYSFALKPEEHQPSGTCNFSRIDTAKLEGKYNPLTSGNADTVTIYAVNYNVLRIMSGMGGLAYSN